MLVPLVIILSWLVALMGMGVLLGYVLPVLKNTRAYICAAAIYLTLYLIAAIFENPIGLMLPFIVAVA